MADPPPISAVILTRNAAAKLPACLDSIEWADEVIVVDSHSTDGTREIARERGATVLTRSVPEEANSFDVLRADGIEHASHEWIMRIDADERVPPALRDRLLELVGSDVADLFRAPRRSYIGDRWFDCGGRWWPERVPILFRRDTVDIRDRVHGGFALRESARELRLPDDPDLAVEHRAYDSLADLLRRRLRYARMEAEFTEPSPVLVGRAAWGGTRVLGEGGLRHGATGAAVAGIEALYWLVVLAYAPFVDDG